MTRQLLAFTRKQVIDPTLLDPNVVVVEMRTMVERLIGEDVTVVLDLHPRLARVMADRAQVEQIVLNLAVNARDAMPAGGTLTIGTANVVLDEAYAAAHSAVTPGPYVALAVADTGTGMSPQVQARLFEPFFTTKDVGKGTGLGLSTVHGIVTRNFGSVDVASDVGRGTRLTVYFPRAERVEAPVVAPAETSRPRTGTQSVLVVEDVAGLRDVIGRMLRLEGYLVTGAASAEDAMALFEGTMGIDVLLTDVVMPGASGPDLARRLTALRPGLRVIFMSGYTEDILGGHDILKPGVAFLRKPFTAEALGDKVRKVLDS
jgi:two-component system, cell cycle sensor histidine kinase and response regulator CckA